MKRLFLFFAAIVAYTHVVIAQGAQGGFDFSPNASGNNYLDLGALPIGTTDFTVEFWYQADAVSGDPSLFSNKNWNSGSNTGINIAFQGNGTNLNINIKGSTGPRKDLNITGINYTQGWNHFAVTVQRTGNLTCYVNGIQRGSVNISASTGDITSAYSYKFGQDGTGNYGYQIEGNADELRIWNTLRTEEQIRTNMCRYTDGNSSGLLAGYSFNDVPGSSAADVTGNFNATVMNGVPDNWIVSGAYLGETSVMQYSDNWNGMSLNLNGVNGNVMLETITGSPEGIHLYRIDQAPLSQNGVSNLLGNTTYYGVFMANNASTSGYTLNYDYSGFASATTNEQNLLLYGRNGNAAANWTDYSAVINTNANTLSDEITGNSEVLLGFFSGTCEAPSDITLSDVTTENATVQWNCTSGTSWHLEYGPAGFTPGNGITGVTSAHTYTLSNLTPGAAYELYIHTDCGAFGYSDTTGPVMFSTASYPPAQVQGPAMALNFDGAGQWVNASNGKVSATAIGLPSETITVESWVYVRDFETWRSVVGFFQDNGSSESGWDLEVRNDNRFCFALSTDGSLNYMETVTSFESGRWYHLAGTYDGATQKLYVNGHLEVSVPKSGAIYYLDSWLAIGAYKDDDELYSFDGMIDEVRIWNTARSAEEIRDLMCEKLTGTEEGLVAYYRLDELNGLEVEDASGNLTNGVFTGMTTNNRVVSGAALGEDSEHLYSPADWNTSTVQMTSVNNGNVTTHFLSGTPYGAHVYRINSTPDTISQLPFLSGANTYYGVFVADVNPSNPAQYYLEWNYAGFNNAVAMENTLGLAVRNNNASEWWALNEANTDASNNRLNSDTIVAHRQFILVQKNDISCAVPHGLGITFQETDSVGGDWINAGSGISAVQWGPVGFLPGSGQNTTGISNQSFTFTPLAQNVLYEFYVQDSCAGENSPWVGPYIFSGDRCQEPTAVAVSDVTYSSATINWNGANGTTWTVSWGAPGFQADWGIQTTATQTSLMLTGLTPQTTYEYYIRSVCSSGNSYWVGPFQFTTGINTAGLEEQATSVQIFPNPSEGMIEITSTSAIISVDVCGVDGSVVSYSQSGSLNKSVLDLANVAPGVYLVTIRTVSGIVQERIIRIQL